MKNFLTHENYLFICPVAVLSFQYMDTLRAAHEEEIQRRRFEQQQIFERQKEMYERNRAMEEQSAQTQTAAPESTEPKPEEEETSGRKRKRGSVGSSSTFLLFGR